MVCWLLLDIFWDVSNCEVYWVCLLVIEKGKLSLIKGHNHRDDCSPWLMHLKAFLKMQSVLNFI